MKARFKILDDLKNSLVDINFKYIDYPYLCYDLELGDEGMSPLENKNSIDEFSKEDQNLIFWKKEEILLCFKNLNLFLSTYNSMLVKNENWKLNTLKTPKETAIEIQNLIEIVQNNNSNKMATLVSYEE